MRLLHVVHQAAPEFMGGTELYTQATTRALARRDHEVTIFARTFGNDLQRAEDEEVSRYLARGDSLRGGRASAQRYLAIFGDPPIERAFAETLTRTNPDLVHFEHLFGLPMQLADRVRKHGIPYVVTLWDYWWLCANAQLLTNYDETICDGPRAYLNCTRCAVARSGAAAWPMAPALLGSLAWRGARLAAILNGAAALIAPTQFVADWYAAHGIARARMRVMRPGVDRQPGAQPPVRGETARPLRFGYVGGISRQKGVHVIAEAFRTLPGDAELWIAGDMDAFPDYAAEVRRLATDRVRFLGRLSRADVWAMLAEIDVLLVPSLWYETFCFVAHEAFAAGAPVIASRIGVLQETVRPGIDGLLVEPSNVGAWRAALQSLVDEPQRIAQMAAQVRAPLTVDEHAAQLEQLYAEVAGQRSGESQRVASISVEATVHDG